MSRRRYESNFNSARDIAPSTAPTVKVTAKLRAEDREVLVEAPMRLGGRWWIEALDDPRSLREGPFKPPVCVRSGSSPKEAVAKVARALHMPPGKLASLVLSRKKKEIELDRDKAKSVRFLEQLKCVTSAARIYLYRSQYDARVAVLRPGRSVPRRKAGAAAIAFSQSWADGMGLTANVDDAIENPTKHLWAVRFAELPAFIEFLREHTEIRAIDLVRSDDRWEATLLEE